MTLGLGVESAGKFWSPDLGFLARFLNGIERLQWHYPFISFSRLPSKASSLKGVNLAGLVKARRTTLLRASIASQDLPSQPAIVMR